MRLYLTSYRIPGPDKLKGLIISDSAASKGGQRGHLKTALIPNAKDYYAERARNFKIQESLGYLSGLGLEAEVFDLRDYDNPLKIKQELEKFDLIWVSGGNTFCLMHQMRRSGFEQVIKELLKEDRIVYAGESAGACAIGSSLRGLEEADEPEFAERVIWEGLSILPNFILPHTDNPMFAADIKYAREVHKDDRQPVIELTDSQALVINGAESEIVEKTEP